MRITRFTVRRLMLAVAIIGLSIAAWLKMVTYWELSEKYQKRVVCYKSMAQGHVTRIGSWEKQIEDKRKNPNSHVFTMESMEGQAKTDRVWLEYYRGLIAKYQRVSRYPWLTVEPDQPDPNGWPSPDI